MSPANGTSDHAVGRTPQQAAGRRPLRLFLACAFLLAVPALVAAQRSDPKPQRQRPEEPRQVKLVPDRDTVSLCPGQPPAVRLTVQGLFKEGEPSERALKEFEPQAQWGADGGRIKGDWRSAVWSLSGVKEGTYTATFNLRLVSNFQAAKIPDRVFTGTLSVKVEPCPQSKPICKNPSLSCPAELKPGERANIKFSWETVFEGPNEAAIKPSFKWAANGRGRIVGGGNGPEAVLQADEVPPGETNRGLVVLAAVGGFNNPCEASCNILVLKPTPTPTPTPTLTPTATPEPSPSNTPLVTTGVTPEPPESSPTATPSSPGSGGTRLLWLLLAAGAALLALLLLAAKLLFSGMGPLTWTAGATDLPPDTGSTSTAGELRREGSAAVIYGGQKRSDVVHCTVFAPPQVAPGDQFIVQVFAHLKRQAKQLAEQAVRADASARDYGSQTLKGEVERGTLLTFTLEAPGLNVAEAHRQGESLVWRGEPESVQFAVDVPEDFAETKPVRCTAKIYSGEARAPVGLIMFMLDVAAAKAPAAPTPPPQTLKRYTHAFVSYCSQDRDKVLPIYLGKRTEWRKAGITDFFDRKDIAGGAGWSEEIQKNLDRCDLFVLFWSTSAQCSKEVGKEIAYALTRKGNDQWNPPTFDPLSIELPVPLPLPKGLESLNFDDPLLYFIKADEAIREGGSARPSGGEEA